MANMAMITIDAASSVPPFEQVRSQLAEQIQCGRLPVGARLPTVRGLALQLGLAANTVARAFGELEHAGLVQTRGRAGTTVTRIRRCRPGRGPLPRRASTRLPFGAWVYPTTRRCRSSVPLWMLVDTAETR